MQNGIVVTDVGLISSVGRSAADACAAIRAGIARAAEVTHFGVLDEEDHALTAVIGHPIAGVTDGFGPTGRWRVMAERALQDLPPRPASADDDRPDDWSRCGVVFVLPVLDDARFFYNPACKPDAVSRDYLRPLLKDERSAVRGDRRAVLPIGPGGLGRAIQHAESWLLNGDVERTVIVAADSLLDAWSLEWLAGQRRLKDSVNPVGLSPGEAAVAVTLERAHAAPDTVPQVSVKSFVFEDADEPYLNDDRRQGRALSSSIQRVIAECGTNLSGDIFVNLNGEPWRAMELGTAIASLPPGSTGEYRVSTPAVSVGDVGAASGALQLACAVRAFARGYAMTSHAWILSSSDYGEVTAMCVEAI